MPDTPQNIPQVPQTYYKPSEIIGIFNSILSQQTVNAQVVYLRGIYLASGRTSYSGYFYDTLRDEDRQEELTLYLTIRQRENLKNGNLVNVGGVIGRNINSRGQIQLVLNVSRIEVVQEQAIDEREIKRTELRQKKSSLGFKNVDSILEQLLYLDKRPKVALVLAQSSITMSDFNEGAKAAKNAIDFSEFRASFSATLELVNKLKGLDNGEYDVVAIMRGGGEGLEKLDELEVLETVANMKTPVISAIGHVDEKPFIKQITDKDTPTPNGLGTYFLNLVEDVSEKKTKSRAALTEQIKKQFNDQLEAGKKQNQELQKKLADLTKNQEEATKKHSEQVKEAQKQNADLQERLKSIQKSNEEQMKTLNEAQKTQQKQAEELNKNLTKLQETNGQLQKSLQTSNTQNNETQKKLLAAIERSKDLEKQLAEIGNGGGGNVWMIVAIVAIIILVIVLISSIGS